MLYQNRFGETEHTEKFGGGRSEWNAERQSGWKEFCFWDDYLFKGILIVSHVKALMVYKNKHLLQNKI